MPTFEYSVDKSGRTTNATMYFKKSFKAPKRKNCTEKKEGYDRSHLIGHQFGGPSVRQNFVYLYREVNRGRMKRVENKIAEKLGNHLLLNNNGGACLSVDVSYCKGEEIPSELKMKLVLGKEVVIDSIIRNEPNVATPSKYSEDEIREKVNEKIPRRGKKKVFLMLCKGEQKVSLSTWYKWLNGKTENIVCRNIALEYITNY